MSAYSKISVAFVTFVIISIFKDMCLQKGIRKAFVTKNILIPDPFLIYYLSQVK